MLINTHGAVWHEDWNLEPCLSIQSALSHFSDSLIQVVRDLIHIIDFINKDTT